MRKHQYSIKSPISSFLYNAVMVMFIFTSTVYMQTTGKISGKVVDAETGEALVGTNIVLEGTSMGAAADISGEYYIINIPPGKYRLKASSVGYETVVMKDLAVSVNRTTQANFNLKSTAIISQEVVISVPGIQAKKDQTSSVRNITSQDMEKLPVESLDAVVGLQAGVVRGHFRGGRWDEVAYLMDGIKIGEAFGNSRTVTIENDVVSEIEVITGTFNAEYGNAMSGVVNAVTKEGSNTFHGNLSLNSSNFYTSHSDLFYGLKSSDVLRSKDVSFFLEGPIISNAISFVVNGRYQDWVGARNGIRRFNTDNYSDFSSQNPWEWYSEHTGDSSIVPMETNESITLFSKLSFKPFNSVRASINYSYNGSAGQGYSLYNKYNPDGRTTQHNKSHLITATINHTLSQSLFYEFKSSFLHSWDANYMFENPFDERYIHEQYDSGSNGPGFSTGGMGRNWNENWSKNINEKFDLTWQVNKNHVIKTGVDFTKYIIHRFNTSIRNKYYSTPYVNDFEVDSTTFKRIYLYYDPELVLDEKSTYKDIYDVEPTQLAAYLQDKMEFDNMVINLGIRFDYFDPNTTYPSQLRNPGNQLSFDDPSKMSTYLKAKASNQISPRFGISYKLGDIALLRFSYGHFFQMPPLYALYSNFDHVIGTSDYATLMGNPRVKPQKTIQYETGLWMQVTDNMSLEVAVYYRDIYDLLGTDFIETFNAIKYGLYSNKDYGNARGLEFKYDFISGPFSANLNYTLQYTRGNADNPQFAFNRAGSRLDPVFVLIPMSWDQRHTVNASFSYNAEDYNISLIARLDSGTPYSWSPLSESTMSLVHLNPNNSTMPTLFSVDLQGFVNLFKIGTHAVRLKVLVYNLLDALNETGVNSTTGRANQAIIRNVNIESYRSNFTTIYDLYKDLGQYSNPRLIKMGIEFLF
ncbi:MAG: TonB-dependent receptor [bacterium]